MSTYPITPAVVGGGHGFFCLKYYWDVAFERETRAAVGSREVVHIIKVRLDLSERPEIESHQLRFSKGQ